MSQKKNFLHNVLNSPAVYKIVQKLMLGTKFRKSIIKKNIKKNNINVLDIGCGPAEIINCLPNCNYYGYDTDKRSIDYAKNKYSEKNYHFYCRKFSKAELKKLPKFDFVILFGIMHHLSDSEVNSIINIFKKKMKKKSILLTEDPILVKNQNFFAKFLIINDRGNNVREKKQYLNILKRHFSNLKVKISHQTFPPYTWFTTICVK